MAKMGESIMEATILTWLKKPGDKIEQDESVLEVATDKVDTEVPSTHAGTLMEILAKEGEVVKVGKPIAILSTEVKEEAAPKVKPSASATKSSAGKMTKEVKEAPLPSASMVAATNGISHTQPADYKPSSPFYSP